MARMQRPKMIVIKIDGTTTARSFIQQTLLPYAESNMKDYLMQHWGDEQVVDLINYLRKESDLDSKAPVIKNQTDNNARLMKETLAYVDYVLKTDKGSKGRQMLYLLIWADGYNSKRLESHVFFDVADAMYAWHKMRIPVCVYNGGNAIANKMLFTFSREGGNLNKFIKKYLDVNVYGPKNREDSYEKIASEFGIRTKEMLFLTDDATEAHAAREAGCKCVIVRRAGNADVTQDQLNEIGCRAVSSFLDILFEN